MTSYMPTAWRTKKQRTDYLQQGWGFSCACKVCVGPNAANSERRRERMFSIDQALAMFDKGFKPLPGLKVPLTARQALLVSEEMLKLLREDAITDFQLAQVYVVWRMTMQIYTDSICRYRECGKYSLKSGNIEKAVGYAKKERLVELYCVGTKTAHLEEDMKGAEYWLAYLLARREKTLPKHQKRATAAEAQVTEY